jgi:hypothetical protein
MSMVSHATCTMTNWQSAAGAEPFVLAPGTDLLPTVLRLVLIIQSPLSSAEKVNEIQIENSCENGSKTATVHSPSIL